MSRKYRSILSRALRECNLISLASSAVSIFIRDSKIARRTWCTCGDGDGDGDGEDGGHVNGDEADIDDVRW